MRLRVIAFLASVSILLVVLILFPRPLLLFTAYSITIIYTIWGIVHVILMINGLKKPFNPEIKLKRYPKFSLIIPARDEPLLSRTIDVCINHVEYPRDKKEIIIVTEDPTGERIAVWYSQLYPGNVKPLVRKAYFPTKPSALNDSLALCTGEIIGIVDTEDIPDRDTFLKVASAFENYDMDSVQVILRISNQEDNWLTKLFSIEYAGWFRVMLNGRARLGLYTPLGGTGNYFKASLIREVGRWDPTNLAEDAEVAIRFYLSKRKTKVLDARHWEEAPTNFKAWLKQRTRWFRGWLQSLTKYFQVFFKPSIIKRIGFVGTISIIFMLIAPLIVVLNWVAYGMTVYWLLEYFGIIPFNLTVDLFPWWALLPLSFNIVYYYTWIAGAVLEEIGVVKTLIKYIPHMIYYMNFMMPLAAFRALYQEIFKEVFWEKTKHVGKGVKWTVLEKHS